MRTILFSLIGLLAVTSVSLMAQVQTVAPTASKQAQPYHRLQRVAIVTATAPVDGGKKPLSSALATTAENSLRGRYSLPPFARVAPTEVEAALMKRKDAQKPALAELPAKDVTAALQEIAKDVKADYVLYVFVKEATSKHVTLQLWEVEAATGKAVTDGVLLRRMWDAYPVLSTTPDGGRSGTAKLPPLSVESQSQLISRMLEEWHPAKSK